VKEGKDVFSTGKKAKSRTVLSLLTWKQTEVPPHLTDKELNRLTQTYQQWFDEKPDPSRAKH